MSRNGIRIGAIALTSVAALGAGGASAWGATPPASPSSLAGVQAKAAAAISLRVDDLNAAISKVTAAKGLGSDAPVLLAYLQADISPLQALGQKIAADTNVSTAQADALTIFTNYRVLALVLPAAHLAVTSDSIDVTTLPALTAFSAKATSRVNASNQAALQPLINDLNDQISAATNGTAGVAATLLGDTPAQWNANHDLLAPSRGSVQAAGNDIAKARGDVRQIRTILKTTAAPTTAPTTAT
jgi:hypothetical protein